jgi:O-antigen/teichoic acid export membrane protein
MPLRLSKERILTIAMDFQSIAKSNLWCCVGRFIRVCFALNGYGVWSLINQMLIGSVTTAIALWFYGKWKLSLTSKNLPKLFGYGSNLLVASLYTQTLNNIYNICIGRYYPTTALGYYTRAKTSADISGTIGTVLQQATFPVFSSIQNRQATVSLHIW